MAHHAVAVAVDPQVQVLLEALVAAGRPSSMSLPLPEARRNFAELFASISPDPEEVERVEDHSAPGPAGDVPIRLYRPRTAGEDERPPAMLVYLHGGGWVFGSIETDDPMCRALANASGAIVASVEYRLAPEHPFPAGLDDCMAALRWLHGEAADLGSDPARMAVAGESSGANLAAAACLRARDGGGPPIRLQVLLYPVLDPSMSSTSYGAFVDDPFLSRDEMTWYWEHYLGSSPDAASNPLAAPARAGDLSGLPPALIVTAENDVLRDEAEAYGQRLSASGVPATVMRVDGMVHGFASMGRYLDAAAPTIVEVGARVSATLA